MNRYTAAQLAACAPPAAARNLLKWGPATTVKSRFQKMPSGEIPLRKRIDAEPDAPALTDDRPANESYFLGRLVHGPRKSVP